MTRFNIELGDWSGDGHNITKTYYVELPNTYGLDQLKANYLLNCEELGFSPDQHIAVEYDEPVLREDYLKILEDDDFEIPDFNLEEAIYMDKIYIDDMQYLAIVMHFFGRGLAHFEWRIVSDETQNLFRGGYGLYTP